MNLEDLRRFRLKQEAGEETARMRVMVSMGTAAIAAGARATLRVFQEEIESRGLRNVLVAQCGERGFSSREPVVMMVEEGKPSVVYGRVDTETARKIVNEHIVNNRIVSESLIEIVDR